ncbi:hypothetical protein AYO40_01940 [Planctomycetaceae bacterium SCGC AG-212-D15]|nr:hypothetical protein AYO40_01940 [Planctomycetaceae bacterium SCGC AG-212-D15]
MELPIRAKGDELLRPGELTALRGRLRRLASQHDVSSVIACAFDHRTRILPFIFTDMWLAPAGVRAVGSALLDCGFARTRVVLQQWNRNFRPSQMRLDGRIPDLFLVSAMQIHFDAARELLRDVRRLPEEHQPLVIVGGAKFFYEAWDAFQSEPAEGSADVAVTGEEYVLLDLLEKVLSVRGRGESMRVAFARARDEGLLDTVAGLVYPRRHRAGPITELVDTGIQRLLGDLDELPHPALGYSILEAPSRQPYLAGALPAKRVGRHARIGSLVMTFGCKFRCQYCPIPAYNQRKFRTKSGERLADEFKRLHLEFGIRDFFGTDDNFFNDKSRVLSIAESLARTEIGGRKLRDCVHWGTEVTVHDTLALKDHLPLIRESGLGAVWMGVEDMTATLVKKGQSESKTLEAFRVLCQHGISPMPMMMHWDGQPLYTRGSNYGLLNQVRQLKRAGAGSLQVLMISPSPGSKIYRETFESGMVYDSVAGTKVEPHHVDGNHVTASHHPQPWRKQLNIMAANLYFYNPLRFLATLLTPAPGRWRTRMVMQLIGNAGMLPTLNKQVRWALRLCRGKITRRQAMPDSAWPMRSPEGAKAAHGLEKTPVLVPPPPSTSPPIRAAEREPLAEPCSLMAPTR